MAVHQVKADASDMDVSNYELPGFRVIFHELKKFLPRQAQSNKQLTRNVFVYDLALNIQENLIVSKV